ncbi:MAG: hypothetical protein QOE73_2216 [Verrucomicrobiota bacterium]|jgi:hypothetical protein
MKIAAITRVFVIGLLFASVRLASANLIVNGDFETGNFSGWTTTPAGDGGSNYGVDGNPNSGSAAAYFGAVGTDLDAISQTFATTPGTFYDLSFWLANRFAGRTPDNEFRVTFGGVTELDLIDSPTFAYTQFNFSVLAAGSSLTLEFAGRNPPDFYFLDDISVEARAAGVPDSGSSLAVLTIGLTGLLLFQRAFGWRRLA